MKQNKLLNTVLIGLALSASVPAMAQQYYDEGSVDNTGWLIDNAGGRGTQGVYDDNKGGFFSINCGDGKYAKDIMVVTENRGDKLNASFTVGIRNGKRTVIKGTEFFYYYKGSKYRFPASLSEWRTKGHSDRFLQGVDVINSKGYKQAIFPIAICM